MKKYICSHGCRLWRDQAVYINKKLSCPDHGPILHVELTCVCGNTEKITVAQAGSRILCDTCRGARVIVDPRPKPWPGVKPIRKTECAWYSECLGLVDCRKPQSKMNCGICACFTRQEIDPADYLGMGRGNSAGSQISPTGVVNGRYSRSYDSSRSSVPGLL